MAVFVRKDLLDRAPTPQDYVYADPKGKALAVNVTIRGYTFLLIAVHAPHKNKEQAAFLKHLRNNIPPPPDSHIAVLMGDFNFVEAPSIDCQPAQFSQDSPDAVNELYELRSHLGGMVDAYRATHELENEITHQGLPVPGVKKVGRRLDRPYVQTKHVHDRKAPCLRSMRHLSSLNLAVTPDGNKSIESDHDAIVITFRLGDIKKAKGTWSYSQPDSPEEIKQVQEAVTEAIEAIEESSNPDKVPGPEETIKAIHKAAKDTRIAQAKAKKANQSKARNTLLSKILSAKRFVPESLAKRKQRDSMIDRWRRQYTALTTKLRFQSNIRASGDWLNADRSNKAHFKPLRPLSDQVTMTRLCKTTTDDQGNVSTQDLTTQEDMAEYQKQQWSQLYNLGDDRLLRDSMVESTLNRIRNDPKARVPNQFLEALSHESITDTSNIVAAISSMHESAGGQDGLTLAFWKDTIETTAPALSIIFKDILKQGHMTPQMQEAIVTLIYKKKGDRSEWKNYRPIAVTEMAYRILGKCAQLKTDPVLDKIIGPTQAGFVSKRLIEDGVLTMTELTHFADKKGRSGIIVLLDNEKAYDRVGFPFLDKVLEAFGFPVEYRGLVRTMYAGASTKLKINGHIGSPFPHNNGVRQGCVLAPALYVLCQEVLLRMIRYDKELKGIRIPNKEGIYNKDVFDEVRERAFADDTGCGIRDDSQLPRLHKIIMAYCAASGSKINFEKSIGIRIGDLKSRPASHFDVVPKHKWFRYGIDDIPFSEKYLGIRLGNARHVTENWEKLLSKVEAECAHAMGQACPPTAKGRLHWARNVFAGKCWYAFKLQTPPPEERERFLTRLQNMVDSATMGPYNFVSRDIACQQGEDHGFNHLDVRGHMHGEYVRLVKMLLNQTPNPPTWQNFWMHGLEQQYGKLNQGKRLLTSSITYELLTRSPPGTITDHMRFAFQMWGKVEKRPKEILDTAHEIAIEADKRENNDSLAPEDNKQNKASDLITIYSDGSFDPVSKQAGYGWIAITGGNKNDNDDGARAIMRRWGTCSRTKQEQASNNTAELEAQIEAIAWLRDTTNVPRDTPVKLRPDSLYAQNIMIGKTQPKKNRELAVKARNAWRDLKTFKKGRAHCMHVRSHQLNSWNAEADSLANKGGAGLQGWSDSPEITKNNTPRIREIAFQLRAHNITEVMRVNRAMHVFGTLRLPLIPKTYPPGRVAKNHEEIMDRINRENAPTTEKVAAIIKVNEARDILIDPASQQKEGARLMANKELTNPIIFTIHDCPIDRAALSLFARSTEADEIPSNKHGEPYRASYRKLIKDFLKNVRDHKVRGGSIRGAVTLTYRHKGIGAELVAAGIISGARVYVDEVEGDPFSALPKKLRHIALAKYGVDFDDDSSHPRAAVDLTHIGSDHRQRFIHNKHAIMSEVASRLWPNQSPLDNKAKVKQLFVAKDMRGSATAWCAQYGISDIDSVLDIQVDTVGWPHLAPFTVRNYFKAITEGLDDIDEKWSHVTDFIAEWKAWYKPTNKDSAGTMQSYLRQEAEATSLKTKWQVLEWIKTCDARPINLQHDGIVVACGKILPEALRQIFTEKCSQALCYTQPVEIKPMSPTRPSQPSMEAIPTWAHHVATTTPLFFDPYCAPRPQGAWNTRVAKENRALAFADKGFTHLKHIMVNNKIITPTKFYQMQSHGSKLSGFPEILESLPKPAMASIDQGKTYEELEWVMLPTKQIARIRQITGSIATCEPHKICSTTSILTPLGIRPVNVPASSLTPSLVRSMGEGLSTQHIFIHADAGKGHYPLEQLGVQWPVTLERRPPETLASLTVSSARKLYVARNWKLPRTMDKGGIFYPYLDTHLSAESQRQEQRKIAKNTTTPPTYGEASGNSISSST